MLIVSAAGASLVWAQGPDSPPPPALPEETQKNVAARCFEPPPLVHWEEFHGPFKRVVGAVTRKLERTSVHPPHYSPEVVVCSLEPREKFALFILNTFDPVSFLTAGFNAGLDQAENRDPRFGLGAAGYSKRFGASFADQSSARFFTGFAYPTLFSEDPRYYRLGHGSSDRKRLLHAVEHVVVGHSDSGERMFNYSEWLGTSSAVALSDAYHPGNKLGLAPIAQAVGYSILADMGIDVLREFWPEIEHRFRMPLRERQEPAAPSGQ